jgi:hypothetical protein
MPPMTSQHPAEEPSAAGGASRGIAQAVGRLGSVTAWPAWVFSLLFTVSVVVGNRIVFSNRLAEHLDRNFVASFSFVDLALVVVGTLLCALAFVLLAEGIGHVASRADWSPQEGLAGRRFALWVAGVAAAILLAWLPYLLTYAPGSVLGDSLGSLGMKPGHWSNHHPVLFSLILKSFAHLGVVLGDINYGIFAFTCFQSIVMAAAFAYFIVWLVREGVPTWWAVAAWAYFAFVPIFPIYAINLQKDPLFSLSVAALSFFLYAVVKSKGAILQTRKGITVFLVLSFLVIFLKNNGMYVFVGTTVALALIYRRALRTFYIGALALLVAAVLIQGPGYAKLHIGKDSFVESVGVPLQQLAYVLSTNGSVTPSQREFLGRLLPADEWATTYSPAIVDKLKKSPHFSQSYLNRHRPRFLLTWAEVGVRNPAAYLKAYCLETFGFWKIGVSSTYGYADTYVHNNALGIRATDLFAQLTGTSIKPMLDATRGSNGRGGYVSTGLVVWVVFLATAIVAFRRRWDLLLVAVPCILMWLTIMIATPVAFSLRYVFALPLCLPGIMLLPFAVSSALPAAAPDGAEPLA